MSVAVPPGKQTFLDPDDGKLLSLGTVTHYVPDTTTFKNTWVDEAQAVLNQNPITLDATGSCSIWGTGLYRQIVRDRFGNLIWDRITGFGDVGSASSGQNVSTVVVGRTQRFAATTTYLIVSGYTTASDGGGGLYVRVGSAPAHTGYFQSADGAIWELVEWFPCPEQFGARADGATDDAVPLQNWINFIKSNLAYLPVGERYQSRGHLRARDYLTRSPLNGTTDGSSRAWGIEGSGEFQSRILGELTEQYPVLDVTGTSYFRFTDAIILASNTSLASCGLLIAQDRDWVFHNHYADLQRCHFNVSETNAYAVAGLVVQNGDLASLDHVFTQGRVGTAMGWRLPYQRRGSCQAGSTPTTIKLDAGASAVDGFYVGYPIRPTSGTGSNTIDNPRIRKITAYNGTTKVATVDTAWPVTPDATTKFEIAAIKSKWKIPQSQFDQTVYWIKGCTFLGKKAFVDTGCISISLIDTYCAIENGGDSDLAVFYSLDYDIAETPGPEMIYTHNFRTENQGGAPVMNAFVVAHPDVAITHSGALEVSSATGACFATQDLSGSPAHPNTAAGSFSSLDIDGHNSQGVLFNVVGNLQSVRGTFRADNPGTVTGTIGIWSLDWRNAARDVVFEDFVASHSPLALGRARMVIGRDQGVTWSGNSGSSNAHVAAGVGVGLGITPYTGGAGRLPYVSYTAPKGVVKGGGNYRPAIGFSASLDCGQIVSIWVVLRQASTGLATTLVTANSSAARPAFLTMDLQEIGSGPLTFYAGGLLVTDLATQPFVVAGITGLNPDAAFTIEIDVLSAANNPLGVRTYTMLRK